MLKNNKLALVLLVVAILACVINPVYAQTTSPYSRYGYGILKDQSVGLSKGMGGISYGLRNSFSANPCNPASYSRVDSLTFLFDIGVTYNKAKLSEGGNTQNDDNGSLDYITMLMPLSKKLGFSIGLLPYSSVGYSYGSVETTDGVSYIRSFSGSGGISQVYAGLGYQTPLKGLSLGANISYLFGSLDYESGIPSLSESGFTISRITSLKIKTLKFDLGLQYVRPVSKKDILTLGAVFTPAMKNSDAKFQTVKNEWTVSSSSRVLIAQDVSTQSGQDAGLPASAGLGFTIAHNDNILVGADATFQKWSNVKYTSLMGDEMTDETRFNDRWKYNLGAEYMIDPYGRSFIHRVKFRGGLNYGNSYLNFKEKSTGEIKGYNEYGGTVGFGIPLRDSQAYGNRISYLNINFEYKKVKPELKNMISEEYFGVSVNVNINELWFFKKKVY